MIVHKSFSDCGLQTRWIPLESDDSEGMIEYNNFRIGNEDSYFKLDQLGRVLVDAVICCQIQLTRVKIFEPNLGAFCELSADGTDLGNAMRGFDYSFGWKSFSKFV